MYIIEKIIKLYLKFVKKEPELFIPSGENNMAPEDILTCSHNFLPIDSTGRIFACSKCGYVVSKKRLKKTEI